ncbi:hypothetical protein ACFWNL_18350 [Kitasatospora sp. NPDC058397]|uniref:hypothetical protein n=1 Tax=unclassified Kitasatospora TaxID=2633591 RepID=UPI0036523158
MGELTLATRHRRHVSVARTAEVLASSGFPAGDVLLDDDQLDALCAAMRSAWTSSPAEFDAALAGHRRAGRAYSAELLPDRPAVRAIRPANCAEVESAAATTIPPSRLAQEC